MALLDADVRVIDMIAICCGNATVLQSVPQLFEISREGAELPLLDAQLGLAYEIPTPARCSCARQCRNNGDSPLSDALLPIAERRTSGEK